MKFLPQESRQFMFCGNTKATELLEQVITEKSQFSFVLVAGPDQTGKSTKIQQIAKKKLGSFYAQDFLYIQDLSKYINKKHTIKVDNDKYIATGDTEYHDIGARQMSEWLTTSAVGDSKILLIENIERMTTSGANALLKSLEEPLPGRQIIATTANPDMLLSTIHSRAITIRFELVTEKEIESRLANKEIPSDVVIKDLLFFAAGKPGRIEELLHNQEKLEQIIEHFSTIKKHYTKNSISRLFKSLQQIEKEGMLELITEARMSRLSHEHEYNTLEKITKQLSMLQANVQKDAVLFSLALLSQPLTQP